MKQYAIPCIIALLVGALYNIVDQIFIANAIYLGSYGNAANTVVFPLTVVALAIAVMVGDGCCAFVSMALGRSEMDKAKRSVGNAVIMIIVGSLVLTVVYLIFADGIIAMFGGKVNKEYGHTLEDIKAGTYQGLSEDHFEKKRKEWIEDIRKTDQPMLRILKAIKYGREIETWETKKHFLDLVAKQKGLLMSTEVCSNMIRKGYSLSQIAEIVPWVTKADIYGLSHMIHKPMELTKEDLWEVELEYRKTGEPAVLKKIFGEPDQNKEGKSEDE